MSVHWRRRPPPEAALSPEGAQALSDSLSWRRSGAPPRRVNCAARSSAHGDAMADPSRPRARRPAGGSPRGRYHLTGCARARGRAGRSGINETDGE